MELLIVKVSHPFPLKIFFPVAVRVGLSLLSKKIEISMQVRGLEQYPPAEAQQVSLLPGHPWGSLLQLGGLTPRGRTGRSCYY